MHISRFSSFLAVAVAVTAAAALSACGSDSSSSGGTSGKEVSLAAPTSGCGSVQLPKVKDPDGVVASLPAETQKGYAGLTVPVTKSPWENFKPKHSPPYKVAVIWGNVAPGFQNTGSAAVVKALKASPIVGSVDFKTTGAEVDVGIALRNFNQAIAQKADIIVVEPLSPAPFIAAAERAQKAGIPVVSMQASIDTPATVNVGPNLVQSNAETFARLFRIIGEKGSVLRSQGIVGVPANTDALAAEKLALKNCPNVKVAGEVFGQFANAAAKSETLKYLGTHPAKIDGVIQSGTMASGIMSAFQQAGRPMPVVADIGPTSGSMAYWSQNDGKYFGVGNGLPTVELGTATAKVALRILEGQGPKLTYITQSLQLLTEENHDAWTPDPDASFTSNILPEGPPNWFLTDSYVNPMFVNGATPKQK